MTTITPLAPAARTILFALEHFQTADEKQILVYCSARDRYTDAPEAMQKLIDDGLVERIDPAPMSGQLPRYKLVTSQPCVQARDEEREWLADQLSVSQLKRGLTTCQEVTLRAIRAGADSADKLTAAVKGAGFTDQEITHAFGPLERAGMIEEKSWGMMSKTSPSEYIRALGLVQLDVLCLHTV